MKVIPNEETGPYRATVGEGEATFSRVSTVYPDGKTPLLVCWFLVAWKHTKPGHEEEFQLGRDVLPVEELKPETETNQKKRIESDERKTLPRIVLELPAQVDESDLPVFFAALSEASKVSDFHDRFPELMDGSHHIPTEAGDVFLRVELSE